MNERISALMDGELPEAGLSQDLARLRRDHRLRQSWDTYHLIGDALRDHLAPALAARVLERLAAEPTVIAPARRPAPRRVVQNSLKAAAGVAGIALVAWMALPDFGPAPQQAAVSPPQAAPVVAVTPVAVGLENYLLVHQSFSPTGAMQGVAPYVRSVSDQRGARGK